MTLQIFAPELPSMHQLVEESLLEAKLTVLAWLHIPKIQYKPLAEVTAANRRSIRPIAHKSDNDRPTCPHPLVAQTPSPVVGKRSRPFPLLILTTHSTLSLGRQGHREARGRTHFDNRPPEVLEWLLPPSYWNMLDSVSWRNTRRLRREPGWSETCRWERG